MSEASVAIKQSANQQQSQQRLISYVIPCYGSEHTIEIVLDEIIETTEGKDQFEIICVNDCSPDNVIQILRKRAEADQRIKVVNLGKNFGQHNALMAGFNHVKGDIIVCLDDDGQTPAKESYKLIDALNDDYDIVYARYQVKEHSWYRNMGSKFTAWTGRVTMGFPKDIYGSSFFAVKRFVIDQVIQYHNPYTMVSGLVLRATNKLGNATVEHHKRLEGKSGYYLRKLISLWLNGVTTFSVKPLRIASVVGFVVAALGIIFGIVIVIKKLVNPGIAAGYSSVMATLLFIGGLLMIMMGLVGEYIGRSYMSLNNMPQFVVKETINIEED